MLYASGSSYEGQWLKDKRHGQGKLILPSGKISEGMWFNDELKV